MFQVLTNFIGAEEGAVTVDWTVLTAAIVGTGIAAVGLVSQGLSAQSNAVDCQLKGQLIQTGFEKTSFEMAFNGCLGNVRNSGPGKFEYSNEAGSDGEPGFLKYTDQPGRDWAIVEVGEADQSAAFGGTLEWSLKVFDGDASRWNTRPVATVVGNQGTVLRYRAPDSQRPGPEWTNYAIELSDQGGWTINDSGLPADNDTIKAVLADVSDIQFAVALKQGDYAEVVGLDGIKINNP